jgi:hypothetical protein
MRKKNMMKNYKDTCQNTLTASGKKDLSMKELQALTCLSILSVQGVIYTHYKNKRRYSNPVTTLNRWLKN